MAKKAYALKIRDAEVMLSGLKSQKDKISNRGINDEYIKRFEELYAEAVRINGIQEKAKADLMTLTKQLDDQLTKVNKELRYCRNVVRTDMPTESWKEFGMTYHPPVKKTEEEKEAEKQKKAAKKLSSSTALVSQN